MPAPSIIPTYTPSTFPRTTPSLAPAMSRSSLPPVLRITIPPTSPTRITVIPTPSRAPRPTLPPAVRAARMMGTVRKFAARLARRLPRHVDVDDLVGAGSLGLVDAFKRRNGMTGSEFEAFAAFRIRGAMLDELRRLDAVPRRSRRKAKDIARASRVIEQRTGAPADEEEVAAEMGLDLPAYQALRAKIDASHAPISLGGVGGEDEESLSDFADTKADGPDALVARSQIGERILAGIDRLSERMQLVVRAIYIDGQTLKEIGASLGVTESRACQIHGEALAQLRSIVSDDDDTKCPPSGVRLRAAAASNPAQVQRRARRSKSA